MPRHKGLWYQQWSKCGRCYRTMPVGSLMMQKGLFVCSRCTDNLDVEYRPKVIGEVLADGQETTTELSNITDDPGSLSF